MNKRRALGVVLVILGGLLAANPLYIYQHPDEINEVRIVSDPRESGSLNSPRDYLALKQPGGNYTYDELSPRARTLFDRAREAPNNITTFYGDDRRPPDFQFVAENESGAAGNWYIVDHQNETYYVWALQQPPSFGTEQRRSQSLFALGLTLLLAGLLYAWRGDQPIGVGASLGALGGVMLLLNISYRYARDLLGGLNVFGGSVFILLALLFGIAGAGYLGYLTARDRFADRSGDPGERSR